MTVDSVAQRRQKGELPSRGRRSVEFTLLYLAVPIVQVAFFDAVGTFAPLAVLIAVGVALLAITPGFAWREVIHLGSLRGQGRTIAIFVPLAAATIFGFVFWLIPDRLFGFPRSDPADWALVMLLYPFASVLGQELLYRPLFFRRYGDLFRSDVMLVVANALIFSLAHAFYQNWVALTLTFIGGLIFAELYRRTGSFPLIFILHMLAGQMIFTSGLGLFFYHGVIPG